MAKAHRVNYSPFWAARAFWKFPPIADLLHDWPRRRKAARSQLLWVETLRAIKPERDIALLVILISSCANSSVFCGTRREATIWPPGAAPICAGVWKPIP